MASAPKPKSEPRHEAAKAVDVAIKIEHGDGSWVLRQSQLGPGDDRVARAQFGWAIMGVFSALGSGQAIQVGADLACALLWMARRKSGEPGLSYAQVEAQFPSYDAVGEITMTPIDALTGRELGPGGVPLEEVADPE